jgi:hypothetical protein
MGLHKGQTNSGSFNKGKIPWNKGKKGVQKNINKEGLKKGNGWNKGMNKEEYKSHYKRGFGGTVIQERKKEKHPMWKGGMIEVKCNECNNNLLRKKCELKTKRYFFCNRKCFGIYKSKSVVGEVHPNWRGGISFEPYNEKFDNKFRREIRQRDNQICMLCGIHKEKLNRALQVHHINYDKQSSIKENCISLCNSCHTKTNFNRESWTNFFQSILSKTYGYSYD